MAKHRLGLRVRPLETEAYVKVSYIQYVVS